MSREGRVVTGPWQAPATGEDRAEDNGTGRRIPAGAECTLSEPRSDASPAALSHASEGSADFNYGALDTDVATLVRQAAKRIGDRTRSSIIDNGRDLIAVKAKLGHGMFGKWLKAEFGWSDQTAQNFMNAARLVEGKNQNFWNLPASTVYKLAAPSTPADTRDALVARVESGETLSAREIRAEIDRAKEQQAADRREQQKLARLAKMSPDEIRKEKNRRRSREQRAEAERRQREEWRLRGEEEDRAAEEIVALLTERLGDDLPRLLDLLRRSGVYKVAVRLGVGL
jgi:hypothetical protein